MTTSELEILKKQIELLDKKHHIEILKILTGHSYKINENKNGSFVNMSFFSQTIINDIHKYLQYINEQEEQLNTFEYQKEEYRKSLSKEVKE
tara:strand:- start:10495 stop:10770 length:276 start_codon:yes stop_codon:yes gene_type:complete